MRTSTTVLLLACLILGCGPSAEQQTLSKKERSDSDFLNRIRERIAHVQGQPVDKADAELQEILDAHQEDLLVHKLHGELNEHFVDPPDAAFAIAAEGFGSCGGFTTMARSKLNQGGRLRAQQITKSDKNKIKLLGLGDVGWDSKTRVTVIEYLQWVDSMCRPTGGTTGDTRPVRLGAGFRIFFIMKELKTTANVNGLDKVAAAKELDLGSISLEINEIGWTANPTTMQRYRVALEQIGVKTYDEALRAILGLIEDYSQVNNVRPQELPRVQ